MKKHTTLIAIALLFGAFNLSAQSTEKNQVEKKEIEKEEVKVKSQATITPAKPVKAVSSQKRTIQKARVEEKETAPIKKEEDK